MSLFRKEAVEHQKENFFGDVLLIQPLSTSILSYCAAGIGLIILLYLFIGTYTPKQTVQGYLVPDKGLSKIVAPSLLMVKELRVAEDDTVKAGQILLTGSTAHAQDGADDIEVIVRKELQASVKELQKKRDNEVNLFELDKLRAVSQRDAVEEEITQLNKQYKIQKERVELAKQRSQGAKKLFDAGNLSQSGYEEAYEAWLSVQQQHDELDRQLSAKQSQLKTLAQETEELPLQHASRLSDLDNAISDINQRLANLAGSHEIVVKAPFDGQVTARQVYQGQSVSAGGLLLVVVPEGSVLHADLYVPTRAIGFIQPGQTVRVRYAAFPHEKFGIYSGKVISTSKTILLPSELPIPVALNEPSYRVTVELDEQSIRAYKKNFDLQPGMLLEADIMLESRSLIEWILSPLYHFKGRV
jgi:membrane fusion protein